MTEDEKELIMMLNDVYEKYVGLPVQHHDDMPEFVNALHILQHLVMIRDVRRMNPDMFPLNLQADATLDSLDDMTPIQKAISETIGNAFRQQIKE